jgi:hypothetical protein
VAAGFACVHAEENARRGMFALEIGAEGTADGMERGIVERRLAGFATNSVGTEELFRHASRTPEELSTRI